MRAVWPRKKRKREKIWIWKFIDIYIIKHYFRLNYSINPVNIIRHLRVYSGLLGSCAAYPPGDDSDYRILLYKRTAGISLQENKHSYVIIRRFNHAEMLQLRTPLLQASLSHLMTALAWLMTRIVGNSFIFR